MAGLFGLSVSPSFPRKDFSEDLFWGTFYNQDQGEKYCGLASSDNGTITTQTHRGLFRPSFSEIIDEFDGTEGIGYCGLSPEPFFVRSKFGEWCLCFSGNIINRSALIKEFMDTGIVFGSEGIGSEGIGDIEIIAQIITKGKNMVDGIKSVASKIKGAYSLLIISEEGVYAAVCPNGHWPLIIGEKSGAVVVASQSSGFDNLGFKIARNIEPGEIVLLKNGICKRKGLIPDGKIQICSFLWVYTAFPNAEICGIPASLVRKRLGAALARRDIEDGFIPHIVLPTPDSGRFHAIGYHQEFCRQMMLGKIGRIPLYDELLLKYGFAGRSFLRSTPEKRNREARIKILRGGESARNLLGFFSEFWKGDLSELIVVVCEDSIVRGTQLQQNLVPKLKSIGIKKIHARISNPPLLSSCPWGKTTQQGELLAERMPDLKDRTKHLKVDSLLYNDVDGLVEAIGLPPEQLCVDCSLSR